MYRLTYIDNIINKTLTVYNAYCKLVNPTRLYTLPKMY